MSHLICWQHLKESALRSRSDLILAKAYFNWSENYWWTLLVQLWILAAILRVSHARCVNITKSWVVTEMWCCRGWMSWHHSASLNYHVPPTLILTLEPLVGAQVCSFHCPVSFFQIVIFLCSLLLSSLLLSVCPVKLHLQRNSNQICTSRGQFVRAVCGLTDSKSKQKESAFLSPKLYSWHPDAEKRHLGRPVCAVAHVFECNPWVSLVVCS